MPPQGTTDDDTDASQGSQEGSDAADDEDDASGGVGGDSSEADVTGKPTLKLRWNLHLSRCDHQ